MKNKALLFCSLSFVVGVVLLVSLCAGSTVGGKVCPHVPDRCVVELPLDASAPAACLGHNQNAKPVRQAIAGTVRAAQRALQRVGCFARRVAANVRERIAERRCSRQRAVGSGRLAE
jgi:hypothetical protein